jgi:hypothetical protein
MTLLISFLNRFIYLLGLSFSFRGRGQVESDRIKKIPLEDLINKHFESIGEVDHLCKESMHLALSLVKDDSDLVILETGSSAWGTNSSTLFDKFIVNRSIGNNYSCVFKTCDIRINPLLNLYRHLSPNTIFYCSDSISFLKKEAQNVKEAMYLIYLDSFDLDYLKPNDSGVHGFKEFLAIIPLLKSGTIILIDDSPVSIDYCPSNVREDVTNYQKLNGILPGKGMFIDPIISKMSRIRKVYHKYQIIYVVE